MKIRNGFVSNSSSSSFIVAFPREPITHEELYKLLCPNCDTRFDMDENYHLVDPMYQGEEYTIKSDEDVVNRISQDMVHEALESHIIDQYKSMFWYEAYRKLGNDDIAIDKYTTEKAIKGYQQLIKQAEDRFGTEYTFYMFSYGDEDGEGWLEHSDIFSALPSQRFSHH